MRYSLLFLLLLISVYASGQSRQGQDRALFFAVNDYQKMTDLQNPIKNAQDLAAELEKRYGFLAEVVTNPTLSVIEEKIASYKQRYASGRYAKGGQLLVFFTGHGVMRGNNGYFMPADADPNRPYASAIEYDYWRNEINDIDCHHTLVAIDACHSITFDPNWKNKTDRNFSRPGEKFSDQVLLNHQSYRARLFFTSDAKGNQTPDRSTFAQQLLTGLRTHASANGYLTSSELFASYLKKAAPTPGGGSFGADEAGSAFLFFRKPDGNTSAGRSERVAWQDTQQSNTANAYRQFLAAHPTGDFAPIARQKLAQLEAEAQEFMDWQETKRTHTPKAYQDFMQKHPNSPYREVAAMRLKEASPISKVDLDNMVFVKGGTFEMGSKDGDNNETPHTVTLSDYYMGRYEVTFEEYDAFCAATGKDKPDDKGWGRGKRPAIYTNWYDAIEYCNWLSQKEGYQKVYTIKGTTVTANWNANGYRLPTEAEWEYAARSRGKDQKWAGTSTESSLADYGNFCDKNCNKNWKTEHQDDNCTNSSPVGSFRANDLGLFDMSGNVYEWCWDWYDANYYGKSTNANPKGPSTGADRVLQGGSWSSPPTYLRCTKRYFGSPASIGGHIGFRLSRAAP